MHGPRGLKLALRQRRPCRQADSRPNTVWRLVAAGRAPKGQIVRERVREGSKIAGARSGANEVPGSSLGSRRPFGENRPAGLKEHQEVGGTVEIAVYDGPHMLMRRGVEVFHEIDAVVEVAVRLPVDERSAHVVFVDVRAAVEVAVDSLLNDQPLAVVGPPHIGTPVAISVVGADVLNVEHAPGVAHRP